MNHQYVAPEFNKSAFTCPHCGAFSKQTWCPLFYDRAKGRATLNDHVCFCDNCSHESLWAHEHLVFPSATTAPAPNPDLSDNIRVDFNEARSIANMSPRGAAALLRLCIQKLFKELGEPGKHINTDIQSLVAKGLPEYVQRALDTVRVVGNEAVHPGTLDFNDNPEVVQKLFKLVNLIAQILISNPKEADEAFLTYVPEDKRLEIEKRDGK